MNHTKLTELDETIFDLIDATMTTNEVIAEINGHSRNTIMQALRRMELLGVLSRVKSKRQTRGRGQGESSWTRAVAEFPGVPERRSPREDIGPGEIPVRVWGSETLSGLPDWIGSRMGLAGLVAQINT